MPSVTGDEGHAQTFVAQTLRDLDVVVDEWDL